MRGYERISSLNERISEWAHFLNLAKRFRRYSNFSAPENEFFFRQDLEGTYLSEMATKRRFLKGYFCNFLGINTHNFVKNDPKFENKN